MEAQRGGAILKVTEQVRLCIVYLMGGMMRARPLAVGSTSAAGRAFHRVAQT